PCNPATARARYRATICGVTLKFDAPVCDWCGRRRPPPTSAGRAPGCLHHRGLELVALDLPVRISRQLRQSHDAECADLQVFQGLLETLQQLGIGDRAIRHRDPDLLDLVAVADSADTGILGADR